MKAVLFLVAISGLCFTSVFAVKCYSCLTGCNDPFDPKSAEEKECDACLKGKGELNGNQMVTRGCILPGMSDKEGCKEQEMDGVKAQVCVCKTDLCNNSNRIKIPVTMAAFFVVVVHFWKYLY